MKGWGRYESTAGEVLKQLAQHFCLGDVEEKQLLSGKSGTDWEIDLVGKSIPSEQRVLIECRLTKGRQSQSKIAAFAFSIQDTGAERGIIVTPNPFQKGAEPAATDRAQS